MTSGKKILNNVIKNVYALFPLKHEYWLFPKNIREKNLNVTCYTSAKQDATCYASAKHDVTTCNVNVAEEESQQQLKIVLPQNVNI